MFDLPPETYRLTKVEKKRGTNRGRFDLIGISGEGAFPSAFTSETPPRGDDSFTGRQPPPTEPDVERPPDGNAGAPENLAATWDAGDVLLVWEHPTPGGDFVFVMERSDSGEEFASLQVLDSSTLMMVDTPVFGSVFSYRIKTVNSVGSSDYSNTVTITIGAHDTLQTYDLGPVSGLNDGIGWAAAWTDQVLDVGITDFDGAEDYAEGDLLNAKTGGLGWSAAWVDVSLFVGIVDSDTMEDYTEADPVNGLSGGSGFSGGWVDVTLG